MIFVFHVVRGSGPEFSSIFFSWREAKFFEALGRTKKQTDREQHKALFWQLVDNRPPRCSPFWWRSPATLGDQIKNWWLSPHVESISTYGDDRLFLFFLQRSPCFENNTFLLVFLLISSQYQYKNDPAGPSFTGGDGGGLPGAPGCCASPSFAGGDGGGLPGTPGCCAGPSFAGGDGGGLPGAPGCSAFGCSGGRRQFNAAAAVATTTADGSESNQQSTNDTKWRGGGATGRRHDEGRGMHTTIKQIMRRGG